MIRTRRAGQIFEETAAHSVGNLIRTNARFATHKRPVILRAEEPDCQTACRPSDVLYEACATHNLEGFMSNLDHLTDDEEGLLFTNRAQARVDPSRLRVLVLGSEYGSFLGVLLRAIGYDVHVAEPRSADDLFLPSSVLLHRVHRRVYDTYLAPFVARAWHDRLEWYRGGLLHMNLFQCAAMKTADAFGVHFSFDYAPRPSTADILLDVGRVVTEPRPPNALVVYLKDESDLSDDIRRATRVYPHVAKAEEFRTTHVRFDAWTERDGCLTPHLKIIQIVFQGVEDIDPTQLERARNFEHDCFEFALDAIKKHVRRDCRRKNVQLVDDSRIVAFHRLQDVNMERCLERLHLRAPRPASDHFDARARIDENIQVFYRSSESMLSQDCILRVGERYFLNVAKPSEYVKTFLASLRPHFVYVEDEAEVEKLKDNVLAATPCFHGCVALSNRLSRLMESKREQLQLSRDLVSYLGHSCRPGARASDCAAKEAQLARIRDVGSDL